MQTLVFKLFNVFLFLDENLVENKYSPNATLPIANCAKESYHPFDPSVASEVSRTSIVTEYKCDEKLAHRYVISNDKIQLTKQPPKGRCR